MIEEMTINEAPSSRSSDLFLVKFLSLVIPLIKPTKILNLSKKVENNKFVVSFLDKYDVIHTTDLQTVNNCMLILDECNSLSITPQSLQTIILLSDEKNNLGECEFEQFSLPKHYGFRIKISSKLSLLTTSKKLKEFFTPRILALLNTMSLIEGSSKNIMKIFANLDALIDDERNQSELRISEINIKQDNLAQATHSLFQIANHLDYKAQALENDNIEQVNNFKAKVKNLEKLFNDNLHISSTKLLGRILADCWQKIWNPQYSNSRKYISHKINELAQIEVTTHPEFEPISYTFQRVVAYEALNEPSVIELKEKSAKLSYRPLISVIVTVYNVKPELLAECISSILAQSYDNFELLIVDDNSSFEGISDVIEAYARYDSRVKPIFNKSNLHICGASNAGLEIATGEFVTFIDHDDTITLNAFYEMVLALNKNKELDFIYSDEDLIDNDGVRISPIYKPDWSPETNISMMYTTHLAFYRTAIVKELGGYRKGYEGAQDFDFVLRITEILPPAKIAHVAKVLYHWRMTEGSTALSGSDAKPYALVASRKAVESAMERRGIAGKRVDGILPFSHRIIHEIKGNPLISIIIPFKDKPEYLKPCIESILTKTSYSNYEIILVDNNSNEEPTFELLRELEKNEKISVIKYDKVFNYAAINNFAVQYANGEYLCLLNNDIEVISSEWLETMLEYAQQDEIGAVGAKLLYADSSIQHAGIIIGLGGYCAHSHRLAKHDDYGYMGRLATVTNISAVTGACLLVSKKKYLEVEGLDEVKFPIAYNDVDFCLKLMAKGYRNIFNPYAKLYHYESVSRGEDNLHDKKAVRFSFEKDNLKQKWRDLIARDPYYNPNLTKDSEDFGMIKVSFTPELMDFKKIKSLIC